MKYRKSMIIIMLAIFLFSIASVCASEMDTPLASGDTGQLELSANDEIIEENINAGDENFALSLTDKEETLSVQNDTGVLGADSSTYSGLAEEISESGNITLKYKNYVYDDGATAITITEPNKVIDGNGAVIDMAGSTIRAFRVSTSVATIKNLTIKNVNFDGDGGAIYFSSSGTVTNCNFINNTASGYGGAVYSDFEGTVINCTFIDNSASRDGAAFYLRALCVVENCDFTNNSAGYGGVISVDGSGTVTNCNFTNNAGGAVYFFEDGEVTNCNFINNSDGGAISMYCGSVENCNFTNNSARQGGAVYFVDNGEVITCNFTDNTATSDGGAVYFNWEGTVTNCTFINNSASGYSGAIRMDSGSVENCNFVNNSASADAGAIQMSFGTVTNCNFTNNSARYGGAVYFWDEGAVTNCNFNNNSARQGGAVYFWSASATKTISNSCFLNNRANVKELQVTKNDNNITITFTGNDNLLNAIYSINDAEVTFTNVTYWGANGVSNTGSSATTLSGSNREVGQNITIVGIVNGNIINTTYITDAEGMIILEDVSDYYIIVCHETDSYYTEAETISTNMKFYANVTSQTTHNRTVNITAKSNILSEVIDGKLQFIFPDGTKINAAYGTNGTWWTIYTFDDYDVYQVNATCIGLDNVNVNNATITIAKQDSTITLDNIALNYGESRNVTVTTEGATGITAEINGSDVDVIDNYTIAISGLGAGNYTLTATTIPDGNHNPVTATSKVTVNKIESTLTVGNIIFDYGSEGSGDVSFTGASEVIANVVNQPNVIVTVKDNKITVSGLGVGNYTLTVTTIPDGNHNPVTKTADITVNKASANITAADVTATYKVNKYLIITLTDSKGNPLANSTVTVELSTAKNYTTDENGQVKVKVSNLVPKTYTAKITFAGNDNYLGSDATAKVVVKKASPKITAKAKTFKTTTKTKKYTITLKDNKGNAIKNAKVTLKVNGKTYKATTNSKGKATFKITKLNKKGTFKATVTYKGNKYYKKVTKKVTIKVKSVWKTVQKGSKNKAIVKKIQRALKNHGYYLTYNGHYLMVDGIFWDYTKMAVKQFQKAEVLKVTGKVDEKTAHKLGII